MQYKVNTTKWKCLDIFKDDIVVKDDNFIFQVQCYIYLYFVLLCDFFYICLFDNYMIYFGAYYQNTKLYTLRWFENILLKIYNI